MVDFAIETEHPVSIPAKQVHLDGLLHIPSDVKGIILFAHGSGSSRLSPRNQHIAYILQQSKFATLLFDLLTVDEDEIDTETSEYRFDIDLLASRLEAASHWILKNPALKNLPMGYFGASTGGAAALVAAARMAHAIKAVVSRGGRADLAGESLSYVRASTLLIVGGDDEPVIELNQEAYDQLHCIKELKIIPGASHLFEEPGKLDEVANLANNWFKTYLL